MITKYMFTILLLLSALCFHSCKKDEISSNSSVKGLTTDLSAKLADETRATATGKGNRIKNMFGINGYQWDFILNPNNPSDSWDTYQPKVNAIKTFTQFRHYLDWQEIEPSKGGYTFNPCRMGGWNLDTMYHTAKNNELLMLACLKTLPPWFMTTFYPSNLQNWVYVPAPYGSDLTNPASYTLVAQAAFQLAARYGSNRNVPRSLVTVDTTQRWYGDSKNVVKIGLNQLNYIECNNEPDQWWFGPAAQQTAEQYAANLSAFYDGNKGKLGKNVGVKTADPKMKVVMGGLGTASPAYVQAIINWCKKNRGYRADGKIDLCFDIINYHKYANDGDEPYHYGQASVGLAPELSDIGTIADNFVNVAKSIPNDPEVWITENGYDINQGSVQRAIPIGNKTPLLTQADWTIRSCLLYMRHGIKRLFFYQLFDAYPGNPVQYGTSGLINADLSRRPAADYIVQVKDLMGNYTYVNTTNTDPLVDKYASPDNGKTMYVLTIPDAKGRTGTYVLNLGNSATATIYSLTAGANTATASKVKTTKGKLTVNVTETPVFVQGD